MTLSIVSIILSENQLMHVETIKDEEKLYLDPIEKSVLAIRDSAREPKDLCCRCFMGQYSIRFDASVYQGY
jgi:hypothetical protein